MEIPDLHLEFKPDQIHLWHINLDDPLLTCPAVVNTLSQDEVKRASRFCFAEDRQHWTAAHAAVRMILAKHLGQSPHPSNMLPALLATALA